MGLKSEARDRLLGTIMGRNYVARGPRDERRLYLTFDDGPREEHTPRLLDLLQQHGARATFFLTGHQAERSPGTVARILGAGHEIANHSYRHVKFATMPLAAQLAEIDRMDELLRGHDGRARHWFRPPQGHLSASLAWALYRSRRPLALWSYDSLDYRTHVVADLVSGFEARPAANGDVILFHDDNPHTIGALGILLPHWRRAGFEFGTLSGGMP